MWCNGLSEVLESAINFKIIMHSLHLLFDTIKNTIQDCKRFPISRIYTVNQKTKILYPWQNKHIL